MVVLRMMTMMTMSMVGGGSAAAAIGFLIRKQC